MNNPIGTISNGFKQQELNWSTIADSDLNDENCLLLTQVLLNYPKEKKCSMYKLANLLYLEEYNTILRLVNVSMKKFTTVVD
jgi:hypothetical protein